MTSRLMHPVKVLMHRNVRNSKYDPLEHKLDLLESNPQYAHVKLAEGRETTVSTKQLFPAGISSNKNRNIFNHNDRAQDVDNVPQVTEDTITTKNVNNEEESTIQGASKEMPPTAENAQPLRRSERICCKSDRLDK